MEEKLVVELVMFHKYLLVQMINEYHVRHSYYNRMMVLMDVVKNNKYYLLVAYLNNMMVIVNVDEIVIRDEIVVVVEIEILVI
jgi:hypothetical protein